MLPLQQGDPERLGDYTVVGRLGEGPRGVAYLGRESEDGPTRVIRPLPAPPDDQGDALARLAAVRHISSSYVARIFDTGTHGGRAYFVREHVEGRSLAEAVTADGPLDADALERVAVGVLTALTAVHLAGITHRGITPHNVILGTDGPRVTDIDLGEAAGEVGYRAPEQLMDLRYGPYADLFGWAATVVFAATGQPPFGQDADAVLHGEPALGELREPLRRVVSSALSKDVTQRPTTYTALLQLLGDKRQDPTLQPPT
ncbi:serine/threonine protein kinase, partial [Nonomuraea sp. NN258]|uniref:serine/threonine protein kinase n=1 Tax=Nonomuraea antri TaxID=2730852 RepID=UPI00156802AF